MNSQHTRRTAPRVSGQQTRYDGNRTSFKGEAGLATALYRDFALGFVALPSIYPRALLAFTRPRNVGRWQDQLRRGGGTAGDGTDKERGHSSLSLFATAPRGEPLRHKLPPIHHVYTVCIAVAKEGTGRDQG